MSDLRDRIHAYLKGRPSGASSEEIASEVLKLRGNPGVFERVVGTALRDDARFARSSDGRWRLAPSGRGTPLDRAVFTVVSLGAGQVSPRPGRMAEVGALRVVGGQVAERFYCAVLPEADARSKGGAAQTAGEANEAAPAGEALTALAAFAADSTWAAEDLQGTLSLLDWEARRAGAPRPPSEGVSLRRLGRRLFPGARVRGVRDLAAALGLSRQEVGRADREADALGAALIALLDRCRSQGAATLEAVLALQEPDLEGVDFSGYAFDRAFLRGLPERPGVYLMFDRDGALLYVGKAKSLRDRMGAYFARTTRRSERMRQFLGRVHDLRVEVVGSELEALLLEGRLIRAYRPEVNVQMEVHERPSAQPLSDAVFVLPSAKEGCVELFMVRERMGLRQVRAQQDLSDIEGVRAALEEVYGGREEEGEGSEDEQADAEIARSWLAVHGTGVSRLEMRGVKDLKEGLRLLRDYIAGCAPTWERVTYV
jgi:DNA polymerase-3 subunit epsilon